MVKFLSGVDWNDLNQKIYYGTDEHGCFTLLDSVAQLQVNVSHFKH